MKILYSLLLMFFCLSCTKHVPVIDTSLQVGNILCSDGSILHPAFFDESKKQPIGIVFWCLAADDIQTDISALAVSLEDLGEFFLIDANEKIEGVSNDPDQLNGAENTASYMTYSIDNGTDCPAIEACLTYAPYGVTGWFLPSAGETKMLFNNLTKVRESLSLIDAETFNGWYWTSTLDGTGSNTSELLALVAAINQGRITSSEKTNTFKIRPVIAIR